MQFALKTVQSLAISSTVAAMVCVVGCAGDESGLGTRYKVSGKVTYKGEPVSQGTVNFIPTKPAPPIGRGAQGVIKDGYYALSTTGGEDGALPGDYNVAIVAIDVDMSKAVSKGPLPKIHEGDEAYRKTMKTAKKLVPDKYGISETSGLKATVGNAPLSQDFILTD
jgi:hypothetical protein